MNILMRKLKLFTLILAVIAGLLVTTCDTSGGGGGRSGDGGGNTTPGNKTPENMSDGTALQYFQNEGVKLGWNLGNSLDAVKNWVNPMVADETAWNNPIVTQALLNGVKAQGFDIVRIPVTWTGHIGSAPNYTITASRLNRVAQVVDYAHNAGLKVIINLHHDGASTTGDNSDDPKGGNSENGSWLLLKSAVNNATAKTQITAQFGRVWTQIAEKFKDHGDWLIFESMNEIHDGRWDWSEALRANPTKYFNVINEWNQLFTTNVRNTGGNNAKRFLMYPSVASSPEYILPDGKVGGLYDEVGKYFKLPTDSAGAGRQIVTFHYYLPQNFAHDAGTTSWGTSAEKAEVDKLFARFKTHFIDRNIPVIIGEMGPAYQSNPTGQTNRLAYISYVYKAAIDNGLIPVPWDDGGNFKILNRSNGQPQDSHRTQTIQAMKTAVGK